jgi:hypothetical protein
MLMTRRREEEERVEAPRWNAVRNLALPWCLHVHEVADACDHVVRSVDIRLVETRMRFCFPREVVGKLRRHLLIL